MRLALVLVELYAFFGIGVAVIVLSAEYKQLYKDHGLFILIAIFVIEAAAWPRHLRKTEDDHE